MQQKDQMCIIKTLHDQQRAQCWEIAVRQLALKAFIVLSDNSNEETNICLKVKKLAI